MGGTKLTAAFLLALWCLGDALEDAAPANEIAEKASEAESQATYFKQAAESHAKRGENLRLKLAGHVHPDALHAAKRETRTVGKEIKRDHAETMLAIRSQQEEDLRTCQGNLQSLLEQKTSRVPDLHRLLAPQVTASSCHTGPNPRC